MPQEYVVRWTGGPIGAGATVLHFVSIGSGVAAQQIADAVRVLFDSIKAFVPATVTWSFDSEMKQLGDDGTLLAVYAVTPPANVQATGAGAYAAGTGLMVRHTTGTILGGRRIQGRTFIVPLLGSSYATTGVIGGATQTAVTAAFQALRATVNGFGTPLAVWSRKNVTTTPTSGSAAVSRVSTLATRNDRL